MRVKSKSNITKPRILKIIDSQNSFNNKSIILNDLLNLNITTLALITFFLHLKMRI